MNDNTKIIFGTLKYVESKGGFIDAMFCKNNDTHPTIKLEFQDSKKELGELQFSHKYAIYKNHEHHKTVLAIRAEKVRETQTGKPVMKVYSCQSSKDYYKTVKKETERIQADEEPSKQQRAVSILQNNVTISYNAQKNALEQAENTTKSLQEMRDFLKMISSVPHKGSLMIEISDQGVSYGYILDTGEEATPRRFYTQDLASLAFQVTEFGEQRRKARRKEQQDE